jgi:hypothetical protein
MAEPKKPMSFFEQIKHPRWQKKRLEVMSDAGFECEACNASDVTLNVHHKRYVKGRLYWEYERQELECLCESCHKSLHKTQDDIKALLSEVDSKSAYALIAGFHDQSDWLPSSLTQAARIGFEKEYAAGLIASLSMHLEIGKMYEVALFAASLSGDEYSEASCIARCAKNLFIEEK